MKTLKGRILSTVMSVCAVAAMGIVGGVIAEATTPTPQPDNNIVGSESARSITVGDLNGDGRNDLIGLKANGEVWFTPNVGGGNGVTWGTGWLVMGGSGYVAFDVGNLNNDGEPTSDGHADITGLKANGEVWFTPNLGGGNGITWSTGWLVVGGSGY